MVKVEMPRASWDAVIASLEVMKAEGYILGGLIKEIEDQVYSQEY
jgi:hypothetical protein